MIEKTFAHHTPSEEGVRRIKFLRQTYSNLSDLIRRTCPDSRERSVALTYLETSAMWAIKAVVVNDPFSQVDREGTR